MTTAAADILPEDGLAGTLVGRVWVDGAYPGPRPVAVREDGVFDLSGLGATLSDVLDLTDVAVRVAAHQGERLCSVEAALEGGFSGLPNRSSGDRRALLYSYQPVGYPHSREIMGLAKASA